MPVSRVVTVDEWAKVHENGSSRSNLSFITVDVEEAEDVSQACGISSMPAFHIYKEGVFIEGFVGSSTHQLRALADRYNAT